MTKILIIEDELSIRENIAELLELEGFQVFSTDNGILGILWAKEHLPDLVISDVMMPEINGHEVLAEMREIPETALIPFVFLTAMSDKKDIRHGMQLGADDYLTKPFTRQELLEAINSRLLKQAQLMKHYHDERQRIEVLELKIHELEQIKSEEDISQKYAQAMLKINTAANLIAKIRPEENSEKQLKVIREAYPEEITLLKQMPNVKEVTQENKLLASIFQN